MPRLLELSASRLGVATVPSERVKRMMEWADGATVLSEEYNDAIIGVGSQAGRPVFIYDREAVVHTLASIIGEGEEVNHDLIADAWEFFHINMDTAYTGKDTPIYMSNDEPDAIRRMLRRIITTLRDGETVGSDILESAMLLVGEEQEENE